MVRRLKRAWATPSDLLQREPQRLGVCELAVEQAERELQRGKFVVGELDCWKVEVLWPQRVVLLFGGAVGGPINGQLNAERVELGAVGVEAPRECVLVHAAVALNVAADLKCRYRAALGHQVRDQ